MRPFHASEPPARAVCAAAALLLCAVASAARSEVDSLETDPLRGDPPVWDDPEALVRQALETNPGLEALRARTAELRASAGAAGTWPDPVMRFEYANAPVDTFRLDERPQSAIVFGVQQTVPPWGWTALAEREANERVRTSELALAEAAVQLQREVTLLFHQLARSRQLERVTRENLDRANELSRAVSARYETGRAAQHELLRLEVLTERLADDLGDFERADRELSASLARAIARPPDQARFATPPELPPLPPSGSPPLWLERAREMRPELERLEQSARAAEASAELALVEGRAPLTFQVAYRLRSQNLAIDDGTDQMTASLAMPLPLGSRQRSRARAAAQRQSARRERALRAAELDRLEAELAAIHARWLRAYEKAVTYADVLAPRARAALDTALAEYAVGRAAFPTLYEAELDLLQIERGLIEATAQTHLEAAQLEGAIGALRAGAVR